VVVDMVYKPLRTEFLRRAEAAGRRTVDGLEMLLRQAVPASRPSSASRRRPGVDVRALALAQLGESQDEGDGDDRRRPDRLDRHGQVDDGPMFVEAGVPVYDADAAVHALYASGGAAVAPVEAAFPGVVVDGAIDRARLSAAVMGDSEALAVLESIVHPLVGAHRIGFFEDAQAQGADIVVLDMPLLYETGGEKKVDKVVVVSAPADVQRARVLARPGMDPAKFEAILARQTPDAEKRARADFVIDTGQGLDVARDQVRDILTACEARLRLKAAPNRPIESRWRGKSSSIPKPPGSTPRPATAWSKSAASRWSTTCPRAGRSTNIATRCATCRPRPRRCTACRRSS
jgi:dephospho-CoA kinase